MIHINADPYDLHSPPACRSVLGDDDILSQRVASHVVMGGESKLLKIDSSNICPKCLEETYHLLLEIHQSFLEECREQDEYAKENAR